MEQALHRHCTETTRPPGVTHQHYRHKNIRTTQQLPLVLLLGDLDVPVLCLLVVLADVIERRMR